MSVYLYNLTLVLYLSELERGIRGSWSGCVCHVNFEVVSLLLFSRSLSFCLNQLVMRCDVAYFHSALVAGAASGAAEAPAAALESAVASLRVD